MDMPDNVKNDNFVDDASVWEAIKTYESVLEKSPDDSNTLESLAQAYETAGDAAMAHDCSLRLAKIYREGEAWAELRRLAEHLLQLNPSDDVAEALRDEALQKLVSEAPSEGAKDDQGAPPPPKPRLMFDLSGELEQAWFLLQNEMISQEQYEAAIAALTESRMSTASESTLSLLQELASMDRIYMDKIVGFLSAQTNTPYVDVSQFEVRDEVCELIPVQDSRRLGILVFEQMGDEVQVAIMNPVDENLKTRIREYLQRRVHFFLTAPENFQVAIEGIVTRKARKK
jgi:tetratricopeptide (TPR) repeat protein